MVKGHGVILVDLHNTYFNVNKLLNSVFIHLNTIKQFTTHNLKHLQQYFTIVKPKSSCLKQKKAIKF